MKHIQFTLSNEEFLMLRSICVIANTNLKAFSKEAVLEHMKKYLSNDSKNVTSVQDLIIDLKQSSIN